MLPTTPAALASQTVVGQLPTIFNRNFATGFLLPVVVLVAATLGLAQGFHLLPSELPLVDTNKGLRATTAIAIATAVLFVLVLILWILGLSLLVVNQVAYLYLEGYGRFNPARLLMVRERNRYRKLLQHKYDLLQKREEHRHSYSDTEMSILQAQVDEINVQLCTQFPDDEEWLLPTRFGNTVRAFEVYPRFVYGLDPITGWVRLLAVIPAEYRTVIDDAKAQTDAWVNLWLISLLILVEYVGFAVYAGPGLFWFPVVALAVAIFASTRARFAAVEWGEVVKASYDVFVPDLWKQLGFPSVVPCDEKRELWLSFSRVLVFRTESALGRFNAQLDQLSVKAREGSDNAEEDDYSNLQKG